MSFIYAMADTWNAVGTTFNSILMNISNGAAGAPVGAAASRAINIQANGTPIFDLDIAGASYLAASLGIGITPVNTTFSPALQLKKTATDITNPVPMFITNRQNSNTVCFVIGSDTNSNATLGINGSSDILFGSHAAGNTVFTERLRLAGTGSLILNTAAIATNAVDGFLYIPTCAGTPTGTPTAYTGRIPMIYDTTNHQFWFYDGAGWKQPKTPAGAAIVTWQ